MRFVPNRRWLQFRLTTWFVLVAILAWALAIWPWWTISTVVMYQRPGMVAPIQVAEVVDDGGRRVTHYYEWVTADHFKTGRTWGDVREFEHPHFKYLALTVTALVAWKVAWAIGRSRRAVVANCCRPQ